MPSHKQGTEPERRELWQLVNKALGNKKIQPPDTKKRDLWSHRRLALHLVKKVAEK